MFHSIHATVSGRQGRAFTGAWEASGCGLACGAETCGAHAAGCGNGLDRDRGAHGTCHGHTGGNHAHGLHSHHHAQAAAQLQQYAERFGPL